MKNRSDLLDKLNERGYPYRIVPVTHIRDLEKEIKGQHARGWFDEEFYQIRLAGFHFSPPEGLPSPRSLIIVAVPRPQTQAVFRWKGKRVPLILPPTYTDYRRIAEKVETLVTEMLSPAGYHAVRTFAPLKLLAVHSGLGAYGRNNICYVPGLGSFLELVGLYSDLPPIEDPWQELQMMETCENCRACLHHCPTGAITEERFLLHAERCIVFHNEKPSEIPFPAWLNPAWHNCLEGCMHCQSVCPEDKNFWDWIEEKEEFSEEETALLLKGGPLEALAAETVRKLERLDIQNDLALFPRNLEVLLAKENTDMK